MPRSPFYTQANDGIEREISSVFEVINVVVPGQSENRNIYSAVRAMLDIALRNGLLSRGS